MVHEDLKPSDIMTREAFENAIVVNSAIGGSTNAPIHLNAIARHLGVPLDNDDWQSVGHHVPLLVNLQPAGEYLGEDYHHAGGVPAVVAELMKGGLLPHPDARTVNGRIHGRELRRDENLDEKVIRPVSAPLKQHAGFINLKGNLFDSAIMKTSVISTEFRERYLSNRERSGRLRRQGRWCSTGRRTITTASTIRRSASTRTQSCSCAARVRSVIRVLPRW
jgi:dihydroxy-acid dehydratase